MRGGAAKALTAPLLMHITQAFILVGVQGSGGRGGLLHSSYMGMCCRMGSCCWDSSLEQGIIFKLFSRMGVILQMLESFKISSMVLTIEQGIKKFAIF